VAHVEIHVAAASDRRFAMPLAVMVKSMLESLGPNRTIRLHVLDCGISPADQARLLESWRDDRIRVDRYRIDRNRLRALPVMAHLTEAAYARLLIPELLPGDVAKVIYLDADALVRSDVGALWSEPLGGACCLAVQDVSAPWMDCAAAMPNYDRCGPYLGLHPAVPNYRELGFAPDDPYFNSGVLVMDLERCRAEGLSRRAFECLDANRRHVRWADQYALNVALHGRWLPLDLAWNQGAHLLRYPDWKHSPFDLETLSRCRFAPRIVHFTTADKPWVRPEAHPFSREFFEVLDRTAWAGWRPPPPWRRPLARAFRRLDALRD